MAGGGAAMGRGATADATEGDGWAVLVEKDYMAGGRSIIMYGLS